MLGRSFISVYKKAKKGPTDKFYRSENINEMFWFCNTVKPSGHLQDLPKCPPQRGLRDVCFNKVC